MQADQITPEFLTACVRRAIGEDAVVLSEGVTNFPRLPITAAGASLGHLFVSGGGSLGWNGGAAVGMKLAQPDSLSRP